MNLSLCQALTNGVMPHATRSKHGIPLRRLFLWSLEFFSRYVAQAPWEYAEIKIENVSTRGISNPIS